jgi:transcriptional regulator with GAF, ATPase, and Fis domain
MMSLVPGPKFRKLRFQMIADTDFERRIILERLEQHNGSQTEAAALHVPLSTLNQKIKRLDIKIPKNSE